MAKDKPVLPDFLKKQLSERLDFQVEEYAARRVFKGLGRVGAAAKQVKGGMVLAGLIEPKSTDWHAATTLLRYVWGATGSPKAMINEFFAITATGQKDIIQRFEDSCSGKAGESPVFFARVGDGVHAAFTWQPEELALIKPPYYVHQFSKSSTKVIVIQGAVEFSTPDGTCDHIVNEIANQRDSDEFKSR